MIRKLKCMFIGAALFTVNANLSFSQIENSSRKWAMAGAGIAESDVANISKNPAVFIGRDLYEPYKSRFILQAAYKPNLLHEDVHENAIWYANSFRNWLYSGVSFKQMRFHRTYYQNIWSLAVARNFGNDFSIGVSVDRTVQKVTGLEQIGEWSLNIGFGYFPNEKWRFGLAVQDLKNYTYSIKHTYLGQSGPSGTVGFGYRPFTNLMWVFDCTWTAGFSASQVMNSPVQLKAGFEYAIVPENLWLRAGWRNNPVGQFFGMGYRWSNLGIDIAFGNYMKTGLVPQFDLTYGK